MALRQIESQRRPSYDDGSGTQHSGRPSVSEHLSTVRRQRPHDWILLMCNLKMAGSVTFFFRPPEVLPRIECNLVPPQPFKLRFRKVAIRNTLASISLLVSA
ncbi:hypothetical protein CY34DRAFT_617035 [Suillus luteus UH-Slu-Lm8-n1]|uniref:Uncharacterized protein n=1 Tax=Suillus luteus UH-Slu-Lm8-n1 TaxID=930992 RepID=A0A0C9ZB65_9AGAM|nr:hypothetical protein CY34DRAFT_617035 [Suillus luteus UH-Slu-Lm8-n1]